MGLGRFFKRATKSVAGFAKKYIPEVKLISALTAGKGGGQGGGGDQSYAPSMQDVARSRAAGSATVNYMDRTPGGK